MPATNRTFVQLMRGSNVSATNRGAIRKEKDFYATPAASVASLLNVLTIPTAGTFLEPCRGAGDIYNRIECRQRLYCELSEGIDYLTWKPSCRTDVIITNPPFSLALEFLQKSLAEADTVIYLLRLNFLGSQQRRAFWQANRPTHTLVLANRPVFAWFCKGKKGAKKGCGAAYEPESTRTCSNCGGRVGPGTDATEYAWFGWDRAGVINLEPGVHVL